MYVFVNYIDIHIYVCVCMYVFVVRTRSYNYVQYFSVPETEIRKSLSVASPSTKNNDNKKIIINSELHEMA